VWVNHIVCFAGMDDLPVNEAWYDLFPYQ